MIASRTSSNRNEAERWRIAFLGQPPVAQNERSKLHISRRQNMKTETKDPAIADSIPTVATPSRATSQQSRASAMIRNRGARTISLTPSKLAPQKAAAIWYDADLVGLNATCALLYVAGVLEKMAWPTECGGGVVLGTGYPSLSRDVEINFSPIQWSSMMTPCATSPRGGFALWQTTVLWTQQPKSM